MEGPKISKVGQVASGITRVGDTRGGNWGCHHSIFSETPCDLFSVASSPVSPLTTFFAQHFIAFYCFHSGVSGVTPLEGVTLHLFYPSDFVSPLFFVNLPTKKISFGCHPSGGCHPGRSAPSLPSDATASDLFTTPFDPVLHFFC